MSENANSSVPAPTLALGKWLGLLVSAVVLAEGIWSILVSLTRSLLLPLMARAIGGDAQSPLGKRDFNFPDLFVSVVELCLAGIVFLSIKIWATRGAPAARRVRRVAAPSPVPSEPPAAIVPQAIVAAPPARPPELPVPPPVRSEAPASIPPPKPSPAPIPPPAPTKAKKPEKPKEVYYNIVGEPITPEDE
jgi:outer membrane biosynthesis protein TonB